MSKNKEKPWSPTAPPEAGKHHSSKDGDNANHTDGHASGGENRKADHAGPEHSKCPAPDQAAAGAGMPPAAAASQVEKVAQFQDRLLRLQADFDNFRKRTLREKNELFESANQELMLEILPVLDHLQLAIKAAITHQADQAFRDGLTLIFDQLMGALSKFGLNPIKTEKQCFDHNLFEAVNTMPSVTEPEGMVLTLVRSGYMLNNKLLRPAQVVVSSGPPQAEKAEPRCQAPDAGQEKLNDKIKKTADEK